MFPMGPNIEYSRTISWLKISRKMSFTIWWEVVRERWAESLKTVRLEANGRHSLLWHPATRHQTPFFEKFPLLRVNWLEELAYLSCS